MNAAKLIIAAITLSLLAACKPGEAEPREVDGNADNKFAQAGGEPLPSCYEASGLEIDAPAAKKHLFVIIDRTTAFDPRIVSSLRRKVEDYLKQGPARVTIDSFSAQTRDHFTKVEFEGVADRPVPDAIRDALNVRKLDALDSCLAMASKVLSQRAGNEIEAIASAKSGDFASTEILASLTQISEAVKRSEAEEKIVLLASDLLEHSSAGSFYHDKDIAMFDLRKTLQKAADLRLLGDFGGARIVTMGAGILPPDAAEATTRDRAKLANLRSFWENWFRNSNGELSDYGEPDLMVGL